jgi:hypothetical protein
MTEEFTSGVVGEMTERVRGKAIQAVEVDDTGMNERIVFRFTDGSSLSLEYDWIYEWEYKERAA